MNSKIHKRSGRWVAGRAIVGWAIVGWAIVGLSAGGTCVAAEIPRRNPLRNASPSVVERDTDVQQAAAYEPTRQPQQVARGAHYSAPASHRTVSLNRQAPRHEPRGFVPRHELVSNVQPGEMTLETLEAPLSPFLDDQMQLGDLPAEGEYLEQGFSKGMDDCGGDCGDDYCGGCGVCNGCLIPCPTFSLNNFEFFGGAQGFTGPANRGETGSFGFHYGVNWAAPVPCMPQQALGMQIGYRGVNSNLSGASFTDDTRNQGFLTAGLFRRVDWGLQGGLVVDYLNDEWNYGVNLTQVRGEVSWVYPEPHEIGFWFTSGSKSSTATASVLVNGQLTTITEEYEPTDLFAFFYRHRFERLGGGYGRLYGGFTGKSDGLLGADFKMPLTENWALQSGFTYLIPKDDNQRLAHAQEAWNVGLSLIWYPGRRKSIGNDYFRPLFDVADNGSFMVQRP